MLFLNVHANTARSGGATRTGGLNPNKWSQQRSRDGQRATASQVAGAMRSTNRRQGSTGASRNEQLRLF